MSVYVVKDVERVEVGESGRVVLPERLAEKINADPGDTLYVRVEDSGEEVQLSISQENSRLPATESFPGVYGS